MASDLLITFEFKESDEFDTGVTKEKTWNQIQGSFAQRERKLASSVSCMAKDDLMETKRSRISVLLDEVGVGNGFLWFLSLPFGLSVSLPPSLCLPPSLSLLPYIHTEF